MPRIYCLYFKRIETCSRCLPYCNNKEWCIKTIRYVYNKVLQLETPKNKKWRKLNNVPALSISLMIVFSTSVSTKNTNIA